MKKNPDKTPRSQIKHAIRQLWLRSRERRSALKAADYRCAHCNGKQSVAKGREFRVDVHHKEKIDWDGVFDLIIDRILQTPDKLEVLCPACHLKEHPENEQTKTAPTPRIS